VKDFVAAPDRGTHRVDDAFSALAYSGNYIKAPPPAFAPPREWLGWIDARGVSVDRPSVGDDLKGDQVNALAGITRKITPDFLVGAFGGYEYFNYNSDALTGRLKGDGWTVGGYLGWRLTSTLQFALAVAHSDIAFDGTAGTASAKFPGHRWLVSTGLTGTYKWQALVLQPSARVYALWEHEDGYTDSLGIIQTDRKFSSGRASGGAKLSYPVAWASNIDLAPYVGLYGDYYFSSDDAQSTVLASTPLLSGWSARVASGLALRFAGGAQLGFGGEFGGIGGNTRIWTWRANASVPF
jgi:outer membrane autotransporter protein